MTEEYNRLTAFTLLKLKYCGYTCPIFGKGVKGLQKTKCPTDVKFNRISTIWLFSLRVPSDKQSGSEAD